MESFKEVLQDRQWCKKFKPGNTFKCKAIAQVNPDNSNGREGGAGFVPNKTYILSYMKVHDNFIVFWPKDHGAGIYHNSIINPFEQDNYEIF